MSLCKDLGKNLLYDTKTSNKKARYNIIPSFNWFKIKIKSYSPLNTSFEYSRGIFTDQVS